MLQLDFDLKLRAYLLNYKCCAFDNCMAELANAQGGAFCTLHESEYGAKCWVVGCSNSKTAGIQACEQHRADWTRFQTSSSCQKLSEWFKDKVKHYHGSRPQLQILNDMMRICQKYNGRTISLLTDFIASKLSVFPVGS